MIRIIEVLPAGKLLDLSRKLFGQNANGRLSSNQYRVCPYSIIEGGFNTYMCVESELYRLIEFDRG